MICKRTHGVSKFKRLPYGQGWTDVPEHNEHCNQRIFKRSADSVGVRHPHRVGFDLCYIVLIHLFQTRVRHPTVDLNLHPEQYKII